MIDRMTMAGGFLIAMVASTSAQDVTKCDASAIERVSNAVATVVDNQNSEKELIGNSELNAAKMAMKAGSQKECVNHLNAALHAIKE